MKYSLLSAGDNENDDADTDNTIFTIKDTKLYLLAITLSAKNNQNLSNSLSEGFERLVFWIEFKTKSENKNTAYNCRTFLESNFV